MNSVNSKRIERSAQTVLKRAKEDLRDYYRPVVYMDYRVDDDSGFSRIIVGSQENKVSLAIYLKMHNNRIWEYSYRIEVLSLRELDIAEEYSEKIPEMNYHLTYPKTFLKIYEMIQDFIDYLTQGDIIIALRDFLANVDGNYILNGYGLSAGVALEYISPQPVNGFGWGIVIRTQGEVEFRISFPHGYIKFEWKDNNCSDQDFINLATVDYGLWLLRRIGAMLDSSEYSFTDFRPFEYRSIRLALPADGFVFEFQSGETVWISMRHAVADYWKKIIDFDNSGEYGFETELKKFLKILGLFGLKVVYSPMHNAILINHIDLALYPSDWATSQIERIVRESGKFSLDDEFIELGKLVDRPQNWGHCLVCGKKTNNIYFYRGKAFFLCDKHRNALVYPSDYSQNNSQIKYIKNTRNDVPKISLEVETDTMNPRQAKLIDVGFIPTRDSSVGGIEWKSPIVPANRLHYLLKSIANITVQVSENENELLINSGTHIHIDFPPSLLERLRNVIIWKKVFRPLTDYLVMYPSFTVEVFGRMFNHYAQSWTGDRYVWVSPYSSTGKTLEWRLPQWVNEKQFNSLIKIISYLTNYIKQTSDKWGSTWYGLTVRDEFKRAVKAFWHEKIEVPE